MKIGGVKGKGIPQKKREELNGVDMRDGMVQGNEEKKMGPIRLAGLRIKLIITHIDHKIMMDISQREVL